jgi:recombination protein RecA
MAKEKSRTDKIVEGFKGKDIRADFNSRFGEGTFFTFGDTTKAEVYPIPTGIPSVDYASGIGGMPSGRIVEVFGPESSGKTSLALMTVAEFQKLAMTPGSPVYGKRAAFIDAEHALDPIHVGALGVDVSAETGMLVNQPDSGEQAFDLMEAICLSNQFGICVVDSAAALVPMAETEHGMDYNPIGLQARLLSQGLRKLKGLAYKHNVLFIFINQLRMKVVMMGNPETTPGGQALRFYSSQRIDVRSKPIEKSSVFIGQATTIKFKKNKVARPFTNAEYDYYWVGGVDRVKSIMDVAVDTEVINRAGAFYFLGEDIKNPLTDGAGNQLKWQGKENLLEALRVSPGLYNYINDIVLGKIPKDAQFVSEDEDDEDLADEEAMKQEALL